MKKIIAFSLSAMALSSCMKDYNCTCAADDDTTGTVYIKSSVKAVSVHRAHEKCYKLEVDGEGCQAKY